MRQRGHRSGGRRAAVLIGLTVAVSALSGCEHRSPSTLQPEGPKASIAAESWWLLFAVAAFVCLVVIAMTLLAVVFRRRGRNPEVKQGDGKRYVLVLGVIIPGIVFAATFALSVTDLVKTSSPAEHPAMTVDVIGHRWWWEFRYDGTRAVTANELHVPVGTPIELRLRSDDVIHSFWVPKIMPKMDVFPHRINQTWVTVDRVGRFQGECAEYCGLQHAHMGFEVVAQPRDSFRSWLADQSNDATAPATAEEHRGMEVFTTGSCATCHTIRGTSAAGTIGPDLTHLATRDRLAGGAIPNDIGHLSGWVADSQAVKPGNRMPPQRLSPADLHAVVTYLESLE
ncbi:cytochrome c oxidase subunit II [Nocardioides terrisoli]|uniref:cytochrome c oxidase subunit II n=1 Tax=Nocardioides terrisoli TaxID=3388267 RepID=UPI00287B6AC2|nr:cytochrome c oxidase subunit II [Nocardioides marmorisolisilvae]